MIYPFYLIAVVQQDNFSFTQLFLGQNAKFTRLLQDGANYKIMDKLGLQYLPLIHDVSLLSKLQLGANINVNGFNSLTLNSSIIINGAGYKLQHLNAPLIQSIASAITVSLSNIVFESGSSPILNAIDAGGTFTGSFGLVINSSTGVIDVSASTPGTYNISYSTAGTCPNSSNQFVTINALDDASFSYSAASFCVNDTDPTPTVTGLAGGTFTSTAGLTINASTGLIDVSVSTPGTYTITYTTTGTCPNSSSVAVNVNTSDDASFNYSASSYCTNELDPTPTITGLAGGTFSSPAGLSINVSTGVIDLSASAPNTYTVTYTTSGSCPNTSNVNVTVNAGTSVTFTALSALCIDAGVQSGLGSGTAAGGVYSGPGVTDDGNGMTYSFDPTAAGAGTHTITYTLAGACTSSATDNVEVFALPTVTFTALADLCIDAGVQTGLGSGSATGGVYSGPGVTDDGNGMTYSFNPALAGVGTHTIAYTLTNANGCTSSANDNVEVLALPSVTFTALSDLCLNGGVQTGLGSGTATGGVYSGPGVTDDGNGTTYSFDPSASGVGAHTITYTNTVSGCSNSANDDVEIFALPTMSFTAPSDVCTGSSTLTGQGTGLPTGGVYSGPGVTDDGNGMTYSFDPATAGNGVHTLIYTFTNANGCTGSTSDDIEVGDATAPAVVCQNITVYLDGSGTASIVAADIDGGTSDNCGGVTLAASQTAFTCADVGTPVNVVLTATDGNSNSDNCTAIVTVLDTISPVKDAASLADLNGICEITSLTAPTATDNCAGGITGTHNATLPITSSGTITWTYDDGNGNTTMQTQEVVLLDAVDPTATNPDTLYFECLADAVVDITVVDDEADNCTGAVTVTHSGDVVSGNGCQDTITRTYNVMDGSGNNIDVTQIIIVEDVTNPTASNLPGINVQCAGDVPAASITDITDASDNCTATPVVAFVSDVSDGQTCPETITRTYSVTDNCGNSIDVTQTITINDTEAPIADVSNLPTETSQCNELTLTAPTATDNCSGIITATTTTVFPLTESTMVTWLYTDDCGNTTSQDQEVVVNLINTEIHISPDGVQITALNTDPGVEFQWIDCSDNSILEGETNSYYLPTMNGDFAVIVTQNGCSDTSDCATISTIGINELSTISFTMYPNPTTGIVNIESNAAIEIIEVLDLEGRVLMITTTSSKINVESLAKGTYIVRLNHANVSTLVKQ